jgi:hypothetical protein
MNNPKHRKNEPEKGDRVSAIAMTLFLATALAGLSFDVATAKPRPVGHTKPETFPDSLVDAVLTPTMRKAATSVLPWHHDVDAPLTHPKRTVAAAPSPRVVRPATPTAKPAPVKPTPAPTKATPKPTPTTPHKGHPGDGCDHHHGRHGKPYTGHSDAVPTHHDTELHGWSRSADTTKVRVPQVVTRGLLRLSSN